MSVAVVMLAAMPSAKRKLLEEVVDRLHPTPHLTAIVLVGSRAAVTRTDSDLDNRLMYRPSEPLRSTVYAQLPRSSPQNRLRI
jgi:hypothetical protein